jgi:drug/metabolite transporter (DMT)-like permease
MRRAAGSGTLCGDEERDPPLGGPHCMTFNFGVVLALACAALTQLGFLCKHRGANRVPDVDFRRPLASARALFGSKWFGLGMLVAAGAWLLHVGALAMAPLSTVQAVLSTGVVMVAVLGAVAFGCRVTPRQWAGAGMTAAGLVLLVVTLPGASGAHGEYAWPTLVAFEAGMLALGALLLAAPGLGAPVPHHGAVVGAAAGILFGVSDVALKALTDAAGGGALAVIASPWLFVAVGASALAFLASARGFQQGDAVSVIACTSTGANVTAIVAGIAVFGDALSGGALIVVQIAAFALVAAAALLTPAGHGGVPDARPA